MNKPNISEIKNKIYEIEDIRTLVDITRQDDIIDQLVFGINNFENIDVYIKSFINSENILLSKLRNFYIDEYEVISYKYIDIDKNYFNLYFVSNENIFNYIFNNENKTIIFDKDRVLKDLSDNKVNSKWIMPKEDEFIEEIIQFLFNLSEIAINHKNKNYIKASLLKNDLVDNLIYMLNCYISLRYNNHVIVDQYANELRNHLDNEQFKEFEYIVSESAKNDIWTIIFKAAQLYRSVALYISEKMNYSYPKKEDVKILSILRQLYKEEQWKKELQHYY